MNEKEFCLILQPKADNQASKTRFWDYRWIGPNSIEKMVPNNNYVVQRFKILKKYYIQSDTKNCSKSTLRDQI